MEKREKTGGREKGTPNKVTKELRETLKNIVDQELDALPAMIHRLPDEKRLDVLVKLLPYVLPKLCPEVKAIDPDQLPTIAVELVMPKFVMNKPGSDTDSDTAAVNDRS